MAPEQWLGDELDTRTDIYAIGCILYETLTRCRPYQVTALDGLRLQHLEAAIPKLTTSNDLPETLNTLLSRCLAKQKNERFSTISELLQELDPTNANAYRGRCLTYSKLQQYDKALSEFNCIIKFAPHDAQAYHDRGVTYDRLQRFAEALSDYNRAIELGLNDSQVYENCARIYIRQQRYDKAIAYFLHVIQLEPKNTKAYIIIGELFKEIGDLQQALSYFNKAAQLGDSKAAQLGIQVMKEMGFSTSELNLLKAALDAFWQAGSIDEMRSIVERFSFMNDPEFIATAKEAKAMMATKPEDEKRLEWLFLITNE